MGKKYGKFYCYWYTIGFWVEDDWSITFSGFPIMHKMFKERCQLICKINALQFTRADLNVS